VSGFSPLCNFCGVKLPAEALFTKEQKAAIEADELRAKQALAAEEELNQQKAALRHRRLTMPQSKGVAAAVNAAIALNDVRRKKSF
jgi:hypothetical protein